MSDNRAALLHFGALIRAYREAAGHATAHSFFRAQGGSDFFGCTYRAYLNVENGASVPQPRLVERLAATLRIALDEKKAKEFALAYLRIILGFEEFLEFAVQVLAEKGPALDKGARDILDRYEKRELRLTPKQSDLLYGNVESYACFTVLANDRDSWTIEALAQHLDFQPAKVKDVLRRLERAGLLLREKNGRYRGPKAGTIFLNPRDASGATNLPMIRAHWDAMARRHGGETLLRHPLFLRASESELRNYFPYLVQGVLAAEMYGTKVKGQDTALFVIETVVRKILPF